MKTENWGRRKMAYEIGPHKEGVYVLELINGSGELMKELERRLRVSEQDPPLPRRPRGRGTAGGRAYALASEGAHRPAGGRGRMGMDSDGGDDRDEAEV